MEASSSGVRPASAQDAAACLAIYRPYVQNTAISWEIDVPTFGEMAARIDGLRATQEWLVLERDDQIIGFAYGQPLKRLAAFQWATETGMSTSPITSAGGGRELYTQLLRWLTERGYRQGFAGITQQRLSSILRVMRRATCWTRPARMNRLARPSPPPQVGYGPLKIRKDVRPSEQGRTKVELGRHCPVRTGTPLSSKNTL
jgi:L-amino acid N-acyltransferase YncA